ncbi:lysophospholipid acyltransferase family protein [Pararhodospirillum oryzae]|uniref:1-acyl-sn-glycerol-3-phosphate acyltransferase n=1 Tax=Pararhodospirillum oryzae TaxID=478448 RepID=A0A512H955_9PROT|nr:lysophospholipid acyltransferase family protein [Pararhodospirillum oryzae]GEO81989.1 1-acyl-sn-glycerol-3-phosphate acyltransferase [Pararhodospirillum oryzae]
MTVLRSLAFNVFYVLWTLVLGTVALPILGVCLATGRRMPVQRVARVWVGGFLVAAHRLIGLSWTTRGLEAVPQGPVIFAAKHQSAYDTFLFHRLLNDPVYVLKKELLALPLVGWYFRVTGMIAVDREAGASALKAMVRDARAALDQGSQIVIFPEGTRVAPGDERPYHPGVAALYSQLGVPVVPVAINSGVFWPRNGFFKRPGQVVIEFLPALEPGMPRKAFLATLHARIEERSRALVAEAEGRPVPPASPVPASD